MSKILCLDPGHSGVDPGAVGNGLLEKNLTLAIVQKVSAKLADRDVKQIFTRTADNTVSLGDRCAFANNNKSDYFLSIHVNAGGGTGFESYVYSGQHGAETDRIRGILHRRIAPVFANYGMPDRGMKSANLQVLRETNMSACLLELGFIDHPHDSSQLKSDAFLDVVAQAIADGFVEALQLPLIVQPAPTPPPVPPVDYQAKYNSTVKEYQDYKTCAEKDIIALQQTITLLQTKLSTTAADLAEWEAWAIKTKERLGV